MGSKFVKRSLINNDQLCWLGSCMRNRIIRVVAHEVHEHEYPNTSFYAQFSKPHIRRLYRVSPPVFWKRTTMYGLLGIVPIKQIT